MNIGAIRKLDELMGSDLEKLGQQAGDDAKAEVLRVLEEEGVTVRKVAMRLNESLDAKYQEAKLTRDGEFAYSTKMTDNKTRLSAIQLAAEMLEMKEPETRDRTQVLIIDSFNEGGEKPQAKPIDVEFKRERTNKRVAVTEPGRESA